MKKALGMMLALCFVFTAAVRGQEKKEKPSGLMDNPIEILKKADAATKAVKTVRYATTIKPTGALEGRDVTMEGSAILAGWAGNQPKQWVYQIDFQRAKSSEIVELTAGFDGTNYYLINHNEEKAYTGKTPMSLGQYERNVRAFPMAEFVHPTPFNDEIHGEEAVLKGTKDIAGEQCYEIHVVYARRQGEATWYFSTKDFLPRRADRIRKLTSTDVGATQYTVTKLVINPKVGDKTFKMDVPEGYTTINQ